MLGIGGFQGWIRIRLTMKPNSPLKPTKVGFIFIEPKFARCVLKGPNCRSCDTSCRELFLKLDLK